MRALTFKFAMLIALVNALGQLAGSQVHIRAITRIFANEIGIYLFMFIIFGLVTAFNLFLLEKKRGVILFMLSSWAASAAGYVYLVIMQADVSAQNTLTMADVQSSWTLVVVSIVVYLLNSLLIPLLNWSLRRDH